MCRIILLLSTPVRNSELDAGNIGRRPAKSDPSGATFVTWLTL